MKPKSLEKKLVSKFGFTKSKPGQDHRWYELSLAGLPMIRTKVSHSRKPISKGLQSAIARQIGVQRPYLEGMVRCDHSRDDYYERLEKNPPRREWIRR